MTKDIIIIFSIAAGAIIGIILGYVLFYVPPQICPYDANYVQGLLSENNSLKTNLSLTNEAKVFAEKQVLVQRQDLNTLRSVYSDLWTDATSCYWANYCLYYEDSCLNVLGDLWEGYTAKEIHIANSDYCESMSRDWERYQSFDVTLKGD